MNKNKYFAVTFASGTTGIYAARNREELSTVIRGQRTPGTQMPSYDAIEVVFPPAPKPITRPDWTRAYGATWVWNGILFVNDKQDDIIVKPPGTTPYMMKAWEDDVSGWLEIKKP